MNSVAWHEQDKTYGWIRLRCGQCGIVREVELSDDEAARSAQELNRARIAEGSHERFGTVTLDARKGPCIVRCVELTRYAIRRGLVEL